MSIGLEQLQQFVAKHETAAPVSTPVMPLGPDAGSYDLDKLAAVLALWADKNDGFQYESARTSKGPGFRITCPGAEGWPDGATHSEPGGLNGSTVVYVENGHPRFSCRHAHCSEGATGGKKTWKNLQLALDPHGDMQRRVLTGVMLATLAAPKVDNTADQTEEGYPIFDHSEDLPAVEVIKPPVEAVAAETPSIRYPIEVWEGTEYGEYARRGTQGNFIPPEFFVESLKTYVGAIAGKNMAITNEKSGKPRFYTILLAGPGTGKNTAIDCTHDFFKVPYATGGALIATDWPPEALVWYPQHRIETRKWSFIGACRMKMSSASGLARSLPRIGKDGKVCNSPQDRLIVVYTELAEMFEKLGIEGSGAAMMSVLCDLYDGEEFVVPALADNDSFGGHLMMSVLAGIQPRKWDIVCAGKGIEGSGFDERINLIPTTNTRTVASLEDPDFGGFKEPFLERITSLEAVPYLVKATAEAKTLANESYQSLKPADEDGPSAGRLNVLAWRNALHYSWLVGATTVGVEAVERGMKLARYQLEVRKAYKPLTGDNVTARAANAIQRFMEKHSIGADVKLRELERAVNANRMGVVFDSALTLLGTRGRIIMHEQTNQNQQKVRFVRRLE